MLKYTFIINSIKYTYRNLLGNLLVYIKTIKICNQKLFRTYNVNYTSNIAYLNCLNVY